MNNKVTLHGNSVTVSGTLPSVGSKAPSFLLTNGSLERVGLGAYEGKKKILNIVPSFDTDTCAISAKSFEQKIKSGVAVLGISRDTPFAQGRFCKTENIAHSVMLSDMDHSFGKVYGTEIADGPLAGLLARTIVALDESNTVLHVQLVNEITDEPDYEAALQALQA